MARGVAARSPASTGSVVPDIHLASSDAKNNAAQATSHGSPSVPSGPALRRSVSISSELCLATIGLRMCPGAMQLTRILSRP